MKKTFLFVPFVLLLSLFFVSCEKEISFENGGIPGIPAGGGSGSSSGTAVYDYRGGTGTCTGALVNGIYTAGTATGSSNTVVLSVDVDTVGTYSITTNTLNGISFSVSGTFTTTGIQNITLTATGTPTAAGSFNYIPGGDGCTFSITVAPGTVTSLFDCKECLYFPNCPGSKYTFDYTVNGTTTEVVTDVLTAADTTIDGLQFEKITYRTLPTSMASNDVNYYRCSGGITTLKAYNSVTIITGTVVMEMTTTPLEANAAVGNSWTDINVLPGGTGQSFESRFSMVEKGISRTVGTTLFNDVIHVHLSTGQNFMGSYIEQATTEYYYAKGVGLIEAETTNTMTGTVSFHQVIKSYFIP